MNNNPLLSWQAMLIKLLLFGLVTVGLQTPVGSITGRLSLEKQGFGLQSYDFKDNKVYVTASGPRGGAYDERGVWVNSDGTFRIDHLPKGEYSLKIHATGYSTEYKNGIFVDDGQVTTLSKEVSLYILKPSVQIASNRKVFTTKELPYFWANCSGTKDLAVRLYKTDITSVLSKYHDNSNEQNGDQSDRAFTISSGLEIYKGNETRETTFFDKQTPVQVLHRRVDTSGEDWSNAQFKLDKALPCGDYVGLAEAKSANGETDWNIFWFSVSDLGLITKQDGQQVVFRAIDLNTLKPVSGVSVQFLDLNGKRAYPPQANGPQTGADGFLTYKLAGVEAYLNNSSYLVLGTRDKSRAYGNLFSSDGGSRSDSYKTYFYTERPVYRLGQTVFFKGMTRLLGNNGLRNPARGERISAKIEDPNNNKVWEGSFVTNAHGCWTGLYKVPEDGHTGGYQMTLTYPDGTNDYESFEIAEYRKPEYEVTVKPIEDRVIAGNKIKARIKASYYFGAPVANARVKYTVYSAYDWGSRYRLMPRPSYYSYFDDWESDDDQSYQSSSYGGDYVSEGTAQTDAAGEAVVDIDTKKNGQIGPNPYDRDYGDKKYTIEAEVTDLSRQTVVSSGVCSVVAGQFALFVDSTNYVAIAGKPISATVTATDYEGKPVPHQSTMLKLERSIWDQKSSTYTGRETAGQVMVTTDDQGKASATFDTKTSMPTDNYIITAASSDSLGDAIYDQSYVWIASENYPYIRTGDDAKKETLAIRLDKSVYKPGEVAHAMVTAPTSGKEGTEAIIAIEGTSLQKYWTVPMTATAKLVDIPILATYEPNVYITVTFVGPGHQYYNQSKAIKVSPAEHFLNLTIETDKEKYKPGEMVKYTVKAVNAAGQPVPNTELSLGLVDESIYSIRSETAPNIQKFFYGKRANWVSTSCTFGEEYSGGPDKTAQVQVRKDFKDTAAWLPELTTDKNGIAVASIKLPDNLTTWRATVRGITMGTDVGATINKIISSKDLIVRLAVPRFFSLGDQTFVSAVVHNYTTKPQTVKLSLSAPSQFEVQEKTQQKLTIEPDKAQRFSWPVKLVNSGPATITVMAIGDTASDAMETQVPVRPLGIPAFSLKSGMLLDDPSTADISLNLPKDVAAGSVKYNLSVAGSSIGPVLGSFDKLIDYPYGCTEQTMSRLMPSIVAMTLHKQLNLPISPDMTKKFAKVYQLSIKKLYTYQHDDGGWGWWQTDTSNPYLTSLVLDGFHHLKDVGYSVDQTRVKNGLKWLSKASVDLGNQLADPKHKTNWYDDEAACTDLSKMSYALTVYKHKPSKKLIDWLVARHQTMSPEGEAYLVLTLKALGNSHWNDCYKRLISLANTTEQYVDWDHTATMMKRLNPNDKWGDYDYRFTGVETTALALRAILAADPANTDLIEKVKNWLLLQHDDSGWVNTKTTSEVFLALLEEQLAFNKKDPGTAKLEIDLADKLLNSLAFDQSNMYAPETQVKVPLVNLPETVTLKKTGGGRIFYNSLATYLQRLSPGEKVDAHCNPIGLSLERSFYRLVPTAKTSDGTMHLKSQLISDNKIQAGETVLMKVTVNSPVALPYVILEAYLPSGAEVVDNSAREGAVEDSNTGFVGDWKSPWWTHQDVLDDRIVFFVTDLPAGNHDFSTMVRMEMPGRFEVNPLSIEGMYAKNVRGYSTLDEVQVSE